MAKNRFLAENHRSNHQHIAFQRKKEDQLWQIHGKTQQHLAFWNLPPEPAEPPEVVSASAAQTPLSTRAGGQDDGSTQTPSNYWITQDNPTYIILYYTILSHIILHYPI